MNSREDLVEDLNTVAKLKRLSKKRKYNKDCILKKIKSRFFKFLINPYMQKFTMYINKEIIQFNSRSLPINFITLKDYFIKDITLKRNAEWDFMNKSILEMFYEHSDMKLNEAFN